MRKVNNCITFDLKRTKDSLDKSRQLISIQVLSYILCKVIYHLKEIFFKPNKKNLNFSLSTARVSSYLITVFMVLEPTVIMNKTVELLNMLVFCFSLMRKKKRSNLVNTTSILKNEMSRN